MLRSSKISLLLLVLAISLFGSAEAASSPSLVINELMASNSSSIQDPQHQYDDWIEIYNYGDDAIDIGGMYLTDNLSAPTRWRIPDNNPAATTIPAGGYLLIWADDDTTDAGLHANFKLSAGGEEIGLFDIDGITLVDSIAFGDQTTDISYGRYPDGDDNQLFFSFPSPGAQNISIYAGEVAKAEFSHERGFYTTPFSLTIATETDGADIYYTLDGSGPYDIDSGGRAPNGIVYTGPIPINKTTYLRAKAVKPGFKPSEINTQTFIFLDDVLQQPRSPSGFPTSWSGTSADYQMDPDIVQDPRYNGMMKDALLSIPTMSLVMVMDDLFDSSKGIYANPTSRGVSWERPGSIELIYPDGEQGFKSTAESVFRAGGFELLTGPGRIPFAFFSEESMVRPSCDTHYSGMVRSMSLIRSHSVAAPTTGTHGMRQDTLSSIRAMSLGEVCR